MENVSKKEYFCITVIAVWMFAFPLPGFWRAYQDGLGVVMSPAATLEWAWNLGAVICAIGLLRLRAWARAWSIFLFVLQGIWTLSSIYLLSKSAFNQIVAMKADLYNVSSIAIESSLIVSFVCALLWPAIVVMFLSYPRIKSLFKK